ncbi:hypothetical protein IscW_ISCW024499 [Ixodes scapularis]|uniref:Uncharacterized protein n=1 Tax=Ixodes scapularis TaxID=6945 RepID=B7PT51_IXOSC|nr:hypothetical protein IscW_ISCW024499 [Ixodes scapularis]|eukprot:XP_002403893.1 hypothetical protein IscW_ISCW024499 [Ixodes scapularis]
MCLVFATMENAWKKSNFPPLQQCSPPARRVAKQSSRTKHGQNPKSISPRTRPHILRRLQPERPPKRTSKSRQLKMLQQRILMWRKTGRLGMTYSTSSFLR